jgi:GntR family transcriptional repressor for pyruvate dehydrogenase complex
VRVRALIEPAACGLSVTRMSDAEVRELHAANASMEAALHDPAEYMKHDLEFHRLIVEASGNSILPTVFRMIQDLIWRQYAISITYPHAMRQATQAHRRILAAIEKRDAPAAVAALRKHLADVEQMVERSFRDGREAFAEGARA